MQMLEGRGPPLDHQHSASEKRNLFEALPWQCLTWGVLFLLLRRESSRLCNANNLSACHWHTSLSGSVSPRVNPRVNSTYGLELRYFRVFWPLSSTDSKGLKLRLYQCLVMWLGQAPGSRRTSQIRHRPARSLQARQRLAHPTST